MTPGSGKPARKKISAIKIVLVSAAVLGVIAIAGGVALFRQVQNLQQNDYYGMDVGRLMAQVFGLESKNLKDAAQNSQVYQQGCLYFIKGVMADRSDDKQGAISLYWQALDQFKIYPGWNNSYAFDSMERLADDYEATNKFADAEKMHRKAVDCAALATNKKHALVAAAYRNLGVFFSHLGRHADSVKAFQSALAIDLNGVGPLHETVGNDYWWIGDEQLNAAKYSNALEALTKAQNIAKKKSASTDQGYIALSQLQCAEMLHNDALAGQLIEQAEQMFGTHDDEIGYYRTRLRKMDRLRKAGELAQADELAKNSLPSKEKIAKNEQLGFLYESYATYYEARSEFPTAEHLLRDRLSQKALSKLDNLAWSKRLAMRHLADCLAKENKWQEAGGLYLLMIVASHNKKEVPDQYLLRAAIPVFRANKQAAALQSAQNDLRTYTEKKADHNKQ